MFSWCAFPKTLEIRLPSCNARQLFIFMFSVILCDGIAHGEFHVHLDFEHGSFGLECELLKINFFPPARPGLGLG